MGNKKWRDKSWRDKSWYARLESNQRFSASEADVLSTGLRAHRIQMLLYHVIK
jgi:hypothetical protein